VGVRGVKGRGEETERDDRAGPNQERSPAALRGLRCERGPTAPHRMALVNGSETGMSPWHRSCLRERASASRHTALSRETSGSSLSAMPISHP
jgi:hypothetical protein